MIYFSDVLICPSRQESFSIVANAALMYGKTVICSDSIGICAYLGNGRNALLFENENSDDLADNIRKVMENPEILDDFYVNASK